MLADEHQKIQPANAGFALKRTASKTEIAIACSTALN